MRERLLFFFAALFIVVPPLLVQVVGLHSPHLRAWRMFSSAGFEAYRLEAHTINNGTQRPVATYELFGEGAAPCSDELNEEAWCHEHPGAALYVFLQCGQAAEVWRLAYDGRQDLCSPLL